MSGPENMPDGDARRSEGQVTLNEVLYKAHAPGQHAEGQQAASYEQIKSIVRSEIDAHSRERQTTENAPASQEEKWQPQAGAPAANSHLLGYLMIALAIIASTGIASFMLSNSGGITGFAVKGADEVIGLSSVFDNYAEKLIDFENVTGVRVSATLEGSGARIMLRTESGELLVAELNGTPQPREYTLTTDRKEYSAGEQVMIISAPQDALRTTYIHHSSEARITNSSAYLPAETGDYQVVQIITTGSDIVRLEVNFTVVESNASSAAQEIARAADKSAEESSYLSLCAETCEIEPSSRPTLIIMPEAGSKVTLDEIRVSREKQNSAPVQLKRLEDMEVEAGRPRTISLNSYFSDPDGQELLYDASQEPGLSAEVSGSTLTLRSDKIGSYIIHAYASDGELLVTGNDFEVRVVEKSNYSGDNNETPQTEPSQTLNESNGENSTGLPAPAQETGTVPAGPDCSATDPNNKPLECLDARQYFQDQTILITNEAREALARVTPIGNLLIHGEVIENARTDTSSPSDYRINYEDQYGTLQAMIWFDSDSGNVYLRGSLHEENANLEPAPGSFVLRNKQGIVLAWANQASGDLYIRGNVVPFRQDVMK